MVTVGETDKLLPVPTDVPPHDPVIHRKVVPEPPVYDNVVDCPSQIVVAVALTVAGGAGNGFTVIVVETQPEFPHEFSHLP